MTLPTYHRWGMTIPGAVEEELEHSGHRCLDRKTPLKDVDIPVLPVDDHPENHPSNEQVQPQSTPEVDHQAGCGHHDQTGRPTPADYIERIPIVGMYNLVHAESNCESRFWIFILVSATVITGLYVVPTILAYAQYQTVLEISHQEDQALQFPPIFFCLLHVFNGTFLYNDINKDNVYWKLKNDTRLARIGRNAGMDWKEYYHWALAFGISNPLDSEFLPNASRRLAAINEMIYKSATYHGANWTEWRVKYKHAMITCENIFSMCTFNGQSFPCCYDSSFGYPTVISKCFKINVSTLIPCVKIEFQLHILSDQRRIFWHRPKIKLHSIKPIDAICDKQSRSFTIYPI